MPQEFFALHVPHSDHAALVGSSEHVGLSDAEVANGNGRSDTLVPENDRGFINLVVSQLPHY